MKLISYEFETPVSKKILLLCNNNELSVSIYLATVYSVVLNRYTNDDTIDLSLVTCTVNRTNTFKNQLIETANKVTSGGSSAGAGKPFYLSVAITKDRVSLILEESLYDAAHLFDHLRQVVIATLANMDIPIREIHLVDDPAIQKRLLEFSCSGEGNVSYSVIGELEKQLAMGGEAEAVKYLDRVICYDELGRRVRAVSGGLSDLQKGDRVVVLLDKSEWVIVILLSLWRRGLVYVPVDAEYPRERIAGILQESEPSLVITEERFMEWTKTQGMACRTVEQLSGPDQTPAALSATDTAYMIYTSGSTGKPKGVEVSHGSLNNFFGVIRSQYSERGMVMPLLASVSFDISLFQLVLPLLSGGSVVVVDRWQLQDMEELFEILAGVTVLDTVPSLYGSIMEHAEMFGCKDRLRGIGRLFIGGDRIGDQLLHRLGEVFGEAGITVTYGPTEGTIFCIWKEYGARETKKSGSVLGRPLDGVSIYVLNEGGEVQPIGIEGEICIGGQGVAKGYWRKPEQTAERFVAIPYRPGERIYRTGDRGRWTREGELEFRGRKDLQVKIRGHRIELGEIEQVLLENDGIGQSVVAVQETGGDRRLVAYVVPSNAYDRDELRKYLRSRLPEHMVPVVLVELETLPLTSNGKVDRKRLPEPGEANMARGEYVAPETTTGKALAGIWSRLLGVTRIGVEDNFFELGGHSLLATRMASAIRRELGREVSIRELFVYPRLGELAGLLDRGSREVSTEGLGIAVRPERIPLSHSQERLWVVDRLEGSVHYHVPVVLRLKGTVEAAALRFALEGVVSRHEILRTVIEEQEGVAYQRVLDKDPDWEILTVDDRSEVGLTGYIEVLLSRPFDLSREAKLRCHWLRVGTLEGVLVLVMHHIASDGWSSAILVKELVELYESYVEGREPRLKPMHLQYADYAIWQRRVLTTQRLEEQVDYWRRQLEGASVLSLPTDYPRPAVQSTRGGLVRFDVDEETTEGLRKVSHAGGATLYMTLLSALKILLHKYSGQGDISVGSPVAGREQGETEELIGFFVNTVVMRSAVQGEENFMELLGRVKETTLGAYQHQGVPFEKVVTALVKERDRSRSPLFQVLFTLLNQQQDTGYGLKGLELRPEGVEHGTSKFDLGFTVSEKGKGLTGSIEYCRDLYEADTIDRMAEQFIRILGEVVRRPEGKIAELKILGPEGIAVILGSLSGSDHRLADTSFSVVGGLEKEITMGGDAMAVKCLDRVLSYESLHTRVRAVSGGLSDLQKGDRVIVLLDRSEGVIVVLLSLWRKGLVYVPVDTEYPRERIAAILQESEPSLVIAEERFVEWVKKQGLGCRTVEELLGPDEAPVELTAGDTAYMIYTSGSTGKPKGVEVSHGSLNNFFGVVRSKYSERGMVMPFVASVSFDISLFQLVLPLLSGGSVVVVDRWQLQDMEELFEILGGVTVLDTVPSLYGLIMEHAQMYGRNDLLQGIGRLFIGGDKIGDQLLQRLGEVFEGAAVTVTYGPTEGTIFCVWKEYGIKETKKSGSVLGRPLGGLSIYVLDEGGYIQPMGVEGEICIGGMGVAKGYWRKPEQTAERFVANPYRAGERLYRTGDRGRWTREGELEFRGRRDQQVKIRGHRIETGEIEACLKRREEIAEAAVTAVSVAGREPTLAAYYVEKNKVQVWPSISEYLGYNDIAYLAMNQDEMRAGAYRSAIAGAVKDKVVVDVGTGPEAILARHCVSSGARKVYAIELLPEVYEKARAKVRELGMEEKIIVLQGDVLEVELPEQVDYCVCALVGNMGSSDGCIPIVNSARRFLKQGDQVIPTRSVVKIAAVRLPEETLSYGLTKTGSYYQQQIFGTMGRRFDCRMGLQGLTEHHLVSTADVFEELDLRREMPMEEEREIELEVTVDGEMDGFVVWLNLHTAPGIVNDIFKSQKSFLPIYMPVFEKSVKVRRGDRIVGRVSRWTPAGSVYPDYSLEGRLVRQVGDSVAFRYVSCRMAATFGKGRFYERVFAGGEWREKETLSVEGLRQYLQRQLPEYMIPAYLVKVDRLPLTDNGKVDKGRLPVPGENDLVRRQYVPPETAVEAGLAGIWSELLGVERVGLEDNFFELGGDSIITIQVVSRARRLGYVIDPKDIFTYQRIGELSRVIAERGGEKDEKTGEQGLLEGESGLLPVQRYYLGGEHASVSHFNQSVVLGIEKGITKEMLERAVEVLLRRHDSLRFYYRLEEGKWRQRYGTYTGRVEEEYLQEWTDDKLHAYQESLSIEEGILVRVVWLRMPPEEKRDRLILIIHHLVVDGVSWRILLDDLGELLKGYREGREVELGKKASSYREYCMALERYANSRRMEQQRRYWEARVKAKGSLPTERQPEGLRRMKDIRSVSLRLTREETRLLLQEASRRYRTEINDVLLCALGMVLSDWMKEEKVIVGLEGHGREEMEDVDVSRTVGWFTVQYPVMLELPQGKGVGELLKGVKEELRRVPDKGLGYGVLKYIRGTEGLSGREPWVVVFNYLGQLDNVMGREGVLSRVAEGSGHNEEQEQVVPEELSVTGRVTTGQLVMQLNYSGKEHSEETMERIAEEYRQKLLTLIDHCTEEGSMPEKTPYEYGLSQEVGYAELDRFLDAEWRGAPRRGQVEGIYRLSGLQEGMLFHGFYEKGVQGYIEQFACTLGGLDVEAFRRCWQHLLKGHSILRSGFYHDEFRIPVQCVYRDVELPVEELDCRGLSAEQQIQAIREYEETDRSRGFDFKTAPLMRIGLMRLDQDRYRMLWTSHHILTDGWSLPIVMEEFLTSYEELRSGREPKQAGSEDRYEEYIRYIEGRDKESEEAYWRRYLGGLEGNTLLPFIGATVERNKGLGKHREEWLRLGIEKTREVVEYGQRNRITVNTLMQGVWAYLLHRYTGNRDLVYGVTVSGRPEKLSGVERRVGMYINTLPLRVQVEDEQGIVEWLQGLQQQQVDSREYQYSGLNDIQRWAGVQGDLFDSLLVFENYPVSRVIASRRWSLAIEEVKMHEEVNYPVGLSISLGEEIMIRCGYNMGLIKEEYIRMLMGHFERVLEEMIRLPEGKIRDLGLLTPEEREQLVNGFNATEVTWPRDKTAMDLFEEQVRLGGDRVAVICGEESCTYEELDERSNQLGHYLRGLGVKEDSLVPICTERSLDMIIGLWGILKAGGAYVPMDADYPAERIEYMLNDIGSDWVLTHRDCLGDIRLEKLRKIDLADWSVIGGEPTVAVSRSLRPDHLAYMIYTSGSTGRPKGVMIEHRGVVNLTLSLRDALGHRPGTKTLQFSSPGFDACCYEIFSTLLSGGCLVLAEKDQLLATESLGGVLEQYGVDIVILPASLLGVVKEALRGVKTVVSAGEALNREAGEYLQSQSVRLINAYGPTENTVCATLSADAIRPDGVVIGKPIDNVTVRIHDAQGRLVPIGVPGELWIGGAQVARGYWRRPELTAEKFIVDVYRAEPGARGYRTGDIGRWLPDGTIEYMGRGDQQVKLRGYRIELGEIEQVLLQSGQVSQGVVLVKGAGDGRRLVGYIVPSDRYNRDELQTCLRSQLPEYMVPRVLVELESLPLTNSGKVDRKRLPDPEEKDWVTAEYVPPGTEMERQLVDIWTELLPVKRIGIFDNFFELGGYSTLATRMIASIKKNLDLTISIRAVFESGNIHVLAKYMETECKNAPVMEDGFEIVDL